MVWGVEPICKVLHFAPSTYYDIKSRPPSARSLEDARLKVEVMRVYKENFEVYGAEKIWRQLGREGIAIGRDRVARLMLRPRDPRRGAGRQEEAHHDPGATRREAR
ncbi:MAG: IS3 family transposase [Acidimicrobiales bacterium]